MLNFKSGFVILILYCYQTFLFAASAATLQNDFQELLDSYLEDSDTPGAVMIVSNPKIGTYIVTSGVADTDSETPINVNHHFRIASISKTFLATAVLKMAERGELRLDDKISGLLPKTIDTNRIPNGDSVTVRELLQMRSGIPNYTDLDSYYKLIDKMKGKEWKPEMVVALVYDKKPDFKEDSAYEYSNTNYVLLQLIIEHITKKPYYEELNKDIMAPLGLADTFVEKHGLPNQKLDTHGYEYNDNGQMIDVTDLDTGLDFADGGMITTINDLFRFVVELLEAKTLLSPKSLEQMQTLKDDYGLGLYQEFIDSDPAWAHNGASSGYQGEFYYFPDSKLKIIILTNFFNTEIIDDLAEDVYEKVNE